MSAPGEKSPARSDWSQNLLLIAGATLLTGLLGEGLIRVAIAVLH